MAGVAGGGEAESSGATWVLGSMLAVLPSEDVGSLRKVLNVGNTWHIEVAPYSWGGGGHGVQSRAGNLEGRGATAV